MKFLDREGNLRFLLSPSDIFQPLSFCLSSFLFLALGFDMPDFSFRSTTEVLSLLNLTLPGIKARQEAVITIDDSAAQGSVT